MTEHIPSPGPQRPSRRRFVGFGFLALIGTAIVLVMLAPILFRGLDEGMQFQLIRRFPFMADWQTHVTPPFQSLPTLAVTDNGAAALLLTPVSSPTAVPTFTAVPPITEPLATETSSPTPTPSTVTQTVTSTATATNTTVPSATPTTAPSATLVIASQAAANPSASAVILPTTAVPPTFTPMPSATVLPSDTPSLTATVVPTSTPNPTSTMPSTSTPRPTLPPTLVPSLTATPTVIPIPISYHATGYKWVPQTWNNCGPANLAQALEPFNWPGDQATAAAYLKPNMEDKNVGPAEMVKFANQQPGVRAITRVAGDLDLVRRLVSQGYSVILQTGFVVQGEGWMGHYLTVVGYDNGKGILYGLDTFLGDGPSNLGIEEKVNDLDARWQHFNRTYIVLYHPERESELKQVLGVDADPVANVQHALDTARTDAASRPDNPYAWFNLGTSYVLLSQYRDAATAYDHAFRTGGGLPWRMLWYQFGPYAAYYYTGQYTTVMTLVNATMQTTTDVEETFYWRGMVEAATGKTALAIQDFKHALAFNPNYAEAAAVLASINNGTFAPPVPPVR